MAQRIPIVDTLVPMTPAGAIADLSEVPAHLQTPSIRYPLTVEQMLERMDGFGIGQAIIPARRYGPQWGLSYEGLRDFVARAPQRLFATAGTDPAGSHAGSAPLRGGGSRLRLRRGAHLRVVVRSPARRSPCTTRTTRRPRSSAFHSRSSAWPPSRRCPWDTRSTWTGSRPTSPTSSWWRPTPVIRGSASSWPMPSSGRTSTSGWTHSPPSCGA